MVTVIRCGLILVGLLVIMASFWLHAVRKMTSDLSVVWCLLGLVVAVVGAVPVFSAWLRRISGWTGLALFCVGAVCLWCGFRLTLLISQLMMQTQELTMQVSLLLQENEELRASQWEEERDDEENLVRD